MAILIIWFVILKILLGIRLRTFEFYKLEAGIYLLVINLKLKFFNLNSIDVLQRTNRKMIGNKFLKENPTTTIDLFWPRTALDRSHFCPFWPHWSFGPVPFKNKIHQIKNLEKCLFFTISDSSSSGTN